MICERNVRERWGYFQVARLIGLSYYKPLWPDVASSGEHVEHLFKSGTFFQSLDSSGERWLLDTQSAFFFGRS